MADSNIDPSLRTNEPSQPVTSPNAEIEDDESGEEVQAGGDEGPAVGGGKRRKLNLLKCRQCREARKKCFPDTRVWPGQKCDRCRLHKPHELECSEPEMNTRTRGESKKKREAKLSAIAVPNKPEPKAQEPVKEELSNQLATVERPLRTAVRGIKRERLESPKPNAAPLQSNSPLKKEIFPSSAYTKLKDDEFRIVVLASGGSETEVCFSLIKASMGEFPDYEAVSYQWADSSPTPQWVDIKLIDPHGKTHIMSTKKNLYNALRNLRHPQRERRFWIDALCINRALEDKKVEENKQVKMKRFIFRRATNLCFWLGEDEDAQTALKFVKTMVEDLTAIYRLVTADQNIDGMIALVSLLKNTVFSRLWFVQEVAVAQNVTLHCGQFAIHFADLVDAVAMCKSFWKEISQTFRRCKRNPKELLDRRIRMAERFLDVSTNALRVTDADHVQRLLSLESLVSLLSDLSATNHLDRIYAVLMIARDGPSWNDKTLMEPSPAEIKERLPQISQPRSSIQIDYGRSILKVYQEFVKDVITQSKALDIICRHWASSIPERKDDLPGKVGLETEKDAKLPTWVRPFQSWLQTPIESNVSGRTTADSLVGLPDHNYYHASRGKLAEGVQFDITSITVPGSLIVKGRRIDTISNLGPRASEGIVLSEWLNLGGCVFDDSGLPEVVPEKFWRTLVADRGSDGHNPPSWYALAFTYCLQHLTSNRDINTSRLIAESETDSTLVVDFLHRIQSVIWNRKFLVCETKEGPKRIGLAPMAAEIDDLVCVLYGCSVPVVLRRQIGDGREFWLLIGECYVHEIMDGEVVEEGIGTEMDFELH